MNPAHADLALRHLLIRLRPLQRALAEAVERREHMTEELAAAGARADCITCGHAQTVLARLADLPGHVSYSTGSPTVADDELGGEHKLIAAAQAAGTRLPLLALTEDLGLTPFELEALTLCIAPDVDPGFHTIYAFLHDDPGRRAPSIELACTLTARSILERVLRRHALGEHGSLRRLGLMISVAGRSSQAQELALTPGALHFLLGGGGEPRAWFRDPAEVAVTAAAPPPGVDRDLLERIAGSIAGGEVTMVGVFGGRAPTRADAIRALAARAGRPLRQLVAADPAACDTAAALGALLWVDLDALEETGGGRTLIASLAAARARLILSAARPWRSGALLEGRSYTELHVVEPGPAERAGLWRAALPELAETHAADLASRFRLEGAEIRAAVGMARATAASLRNGHAVSPIDHLEAAAAAVARPSSLRFGTMIEPRHGLDDLVLPAEDRARVLEIAAYQRHGARVLGEWGFRHRLTGSGGVKALFCGEPGTGKSLAAEVVGKLLGLPLLKIDLARVVSKWVGETEKNLDAAFHEAEDGHAVLFFDEAEALFGARADVRSGSDRYANLEVSFLLQRLDAYAGVAILATNMRDKIDAAFMRRFHVVVGFRRPQAAERRRLWQLAFPATAPLADDVDLDDLVRFDLTGAGIVGAAQGAAFLAAEEQAPAIAMSHVVRGLVRQFQREARILSKSELGRHAALLERA